MKVSILTPWRGGDEHRKTLRHWVHGRWELILPGAEHVYGESPEGPFNRAAALNRAAREATGEVFVVADADTAPLATSVQLGMKFLESAHPCWVLPYAVYFNLTEEATEHLLGCDPGWEISPPRPGEYEYMLTNSVSGVVLVTRHAWMTVRGFDERFVGWGGEDRAFQRALEVLWGECIRVPSYVVHLWHHAPESARFLNPNWPANEVLMQRYQAASKREMEELVRNR